jgi:hypothetical protein
MRTVTDIDAQQGRHYYRFAVVVVARPMAGLNWRVYAKRVSFGKEGSY